MVSFTSTILLIALAVAAVKATDTAGDPANIKNWPPCAVYRTKLQPGHHGLTKFYQQQTCIPKGLTASSCRSLSQRRCVCDSITYSVTVAGCEIEICNQTELARNLNPPLSDHSPPSLTNLSRDHEPDHLPLRPRRWRGF